MFRPFEKDGILSFLQRNRWENQSDLWFWASHFLTITVITWKLVSKKKNHSMAQSFSRDHIETG